MKKMFSANITFIFSALLFCIETKPIDYAAITLLITAVIVFILVKAFDIAQNFERFKKFGKYLVYAEGVSLFLSAAAAVFNAVICFYSASQFRISTVSTAPLAIFVILLYIIFINRAYDPNNDEGTRSSYGIFESHLLPNQIKFVYRESEPFMAGALFPSLIASFLFSDTSKILSVLFAVLLIFLGLFYARMKIKPELDLKKRNEKRELEEEIRKEQGL